MSDLNMDLMRLAPVSSVARLVHELVDRRNVQSDLRGNYLSLRPMPIGAIAIYVQPRRVSIAMEPHQAKLTVGSVAGAVLDPRTPATTYLVVPHDAIEVHYERVLELATRAVDWRATGPKRTLGESRSASRTEQPQTCQRCCMQRTPAGVCGCND
jgi:hypothetical protein